MSAIDDILGVKESTTTSGIPAVDTGRPVMVSPALKTRRKLRRRLKEETDETKPAIPDDAKPYKPGTSAINPNVNGQIDPASLEDDDVLEPYVQTAVCLVAPDTTPESMAPLDPSQVPQPVQSSSPVAAAPAAPQSSDSVMRTLLGQHQKNYKPVSVEAQPAPGQELAAEGVDPKAAVTAMMEGDVGAASANRVASIQATLLSGAPMPPPKVNIIESTRRACSAMRAVLGD